MSVHDGRPRETAVEMCVMDLFCLRAYSSGVMSAVLT